MYTHYAIHRLRYSPRDLVDLWNMETPHKAFWYASMAVELDRQRKEQQRIQSKAKK
ncbi:hypothetical protein [Paenibacillus sanguinis]|uniref:hypothetical protein n=1 Tax=Paenibacillus sanguinis TaxID=225906 RepID=UPI00039E6F55|nr:hypothetical protein [Paenibacillus sanguinis]